MDGWQTHKKSSRGRSCFANTYYGPITPVKCEERGPDRHCSGVIMVMPEMQQWVEAARAEPADIGALEVDY
jgi:hypothetical protein